jgi:hypothetical protein
MIIVMLTVKLCLGRHCCQGWPLCMKGNCAMDGRLAFNAEGNIPKGGQLCQEGDVATKSTLKGFLFSQGMRHPAPLYKLARLRISSIASPLLCHQSLDFRPHHAVLSAFLAWSNFDWRGCFLSLLHTGSPPQIGVDVSCHCFTQGCHLNLMRGAWLLVNVSCPCFTQICHLKLGVDVSCHCFTQVCHRDLAREARLLTGYCYHFFLPS